MNTPELQETTSVRARDLEATLADMIYGASQPEQTTEHWQQIDAVWSNHPTLSISQGAVSGRFTRESVGYYLGSLPGFSIQVATETAAGERNIQLSLDKRAPSFRIRSLVELYEFPEITPTAINYTQLPTTEAFDWHAAIGELYADTDIDPAKELYLVVFRSKLAEHADTRLLHEHDTHAHQAAQQSPALLHYFGGLPDEEGRALSFCLWSDREVAQSISRDARHQAAAEMVRMYESYSVERYAVRHADGETLLIPA